ncbi:MAG: Abi-alpha family protein [Candidatus Gracilibacteria bacterium]|nr:Abi-alpha family protein [Candidatus Gracilibacteria bacterium]MDD2908372.1 Abi-alpha family protein [Candidatus Gracilibacteria bacterium]
MNKNKIVKKIGFQIADMFNIGTSIQIETPETLKSVEEFMNNTGIVNSIGFLKNRIFGEKITNNAINVISGTENKLLESGFTGERKEIPTKIAVNLIENSSLEDLKNLQDIWSNMLANAVTGKVEIKKSYIDILTQITEIEVIFLNNIFENVENQKLINLDYDMRNMGFSKSYFTSFLNLSDELYEIIVDNLVRLNLIHTGDGEKTNNKDILYRSLHMKRGIIMLTFLGYEFIKACKYK